MSISAILQDRSNLQRVLKSLLIYGISVGLMAYVRLGIYPQQFITLTYALPLLLCLWHRDKILLWAMSATFIALTSYKAFVWMRIAGGLEWLQWAMQVINVLVPGIVIHLVIDLLSRLRLEREDLERTHGELITREEEISRQSEEMQAQSEELIQQNEELGHQAEELQAQSEELQNLNLELTQREGMLLDILSSLRDTNSEQELVQQVCATLGRLLGPGIGAVAVVEQRDDQVVVQTWSGKYKPPVQSWPFQDSFTEVIVERGLTACVDLENRPDLAVPHPPGRKFRSVLATPLRLKNRTVGAVKAYSEDSREWTREHFRMIEWVAAQCSMAMDITRLRSELSDANLNLEKTVQERTAQLREMVDELEHFSYTITHDMRAPLRAIQGFAGLLEELAGGDLQPEGRDCLHHLSRSAGRMDRLITDALSYSKSVQQELYLHPVETEELLRGIIYSYPLLQPPKAKIQLQEGLPKVIANEAGLTQCFSNLLSNAVKFVAPGVVPEVRVWGERRGLMVRLWFADNGIGIPPQVRPRLFQMFQRASKEYEGTGVGLALVRKVAGRMHGAVGVESTPGQGSRFWLELPAAEGGPARDGNGTNHLSDLSHPNGVAGRIMM